MQFSGLSAARQDHSRLRVVSATARHGQLLIRREILRAGPRSGSREGLSDRGCRASNITRGGVLSTT